jgi:hypothetical protein
MIRFIQNTILDHSYFLRHIAKNKCKEVYQGTNVKMDTNYSKQE